MELTGDTLHLVKKACLIARSLQPAMIVIEDVDLTAEQRDHHGGPTPLMFTLLNEMDGLGKDADGSSCSPRTGRTCGPARAGADLAPRPGRPGGADRLPCPDSRRRLIAIPSSVSADDLDGAVEDLLDSCNRMTRSVLGFGSDGEPDA